MTARRIASRAKTAPIQTLHNLLTVQEASNAVRRRPSPGPFLLTYNSLPAWRQDNHFILTHYRPESYSYAKSLQSLFYIHNESVNIHSHLLGVFLFTFISLSLYVFERYNVRTGDVAAFGCFFGGAIVCLGVSAGYHLISNHSPEVNRLGNQLDYLGIVALIWGSMVPSVYYGFYCEPMLQNVYWAMISSLSLACSWVSINPKFRTPLWRPFRAYMFVALGLSAIFPVLHGLAVHGHGQMKQSIGLYWAALQGLLYILGAAIYAARVPERFQPGRFDVWGSSHQIFHVLILLAAMSQLMGLLTAFHYARAYARC